MRPERIRITNELGTLRTLPSGPEQFDRLAGTQGAKNAQDVLFLGLGPAPADAAALVPPGARVRYLECPAMEAQLPPAWSAAIPETWERIAPEALSAPGMAAFLPESVVFVHRQAPRLFPSFWGPLVASVQLEYLRAGLQPEPSRTVLLATRRDGLLARELTLAFEKAGFTVRLVEPDTAHAQIPKLLRDETPRLFCSVNFAGLDAHGAHHHLLSRACVPTAVWCVDNPWHQLSGLAAPFWQELFLFVTDHSFVAPLLAHGARNVTHLPLAACPELFSPAADVRSSSGENVIDAAPYADLAQRLVFVGRTAFPDKQGFFSGCRLDDSAFAEAQVLLALGRRPDFDWWTQRAEGVDPSRLWPGNEVRAAGLGAEESGRFWRSLCVREAAAAHPVTVFGDQGWSGLAPDLADLRAPVDYYGPLARIYARARAVLNATSLLLPAGLTQRHFDVWTAGGVLLSDATPGLDIFPEELVAPIRFHAPHEIAPTLEALYAAPARLARLRGDWRAHILAHHTYAQRIGTILRTCTP